MQTVSGDPATLVAATLAQAEIVLRAATMADNKVVKLAEGHGARSQVRASYEYWLAVVSTGNPPKANLE